MNITRQPTADELRLIDHLVSLASSKIKGEWKEGLLVKYMDEARTGSLLLYPRGKVNDGRAFGAQVSEYHFKDADRADVIASLNTDANGDLFELDIWKTTFNPLIRIPENLK